MAELRFHNVPPEGFVAFASELATDEWGNIDITPHIGPNCTTTQPFFTIPLLVAYKILLTWVIDTLVGTRENARSAKDVDQDWDDSQRRLRALLDMWSAHKDALKREAAARLRKALLRGAGTAQTQLSYQKEVEFGRQQLETVAKGQAADDVALLDLGSAIDDIRQATDALASAIGYGQATGRPFEQREAALATCIETFESITQNLGYIAANKALGAESLRAAKLRAPFEALAARHPAGSTTTADDTATDEEPPATDDTPST